MRKYMLMDKIEEKTTGTPGDTAKTVAGYVAVEPAKVEEVPAFDDLGYPTVAKEAAPKDVVKEVLEIKKEEAKEKEIVAATGYDEKPPKAEDKKEAKTEEEKKPEEKAKEVELDLKDLPEEDAIDLKQFVKEHNVPKELAQVMADKKKAEYKKYEIALKARKEKIEKDQEKLKADWHDELKNDSTFGGEKFSYNIKQAEKVIDQFMPNLKSQLLKNKAMLPPYVMKDLAKLAKHLYSSEVLTQGDPIVQTKATDDKEDHLAFYT